METSRIYSVVVQLCLDATSSPIPQLVLRPDLALTLSTLLRPTGFVTNRKRKDGRSYCPTTAIPNKRRVPKAMEVSF